MREAHIKYLVCPSCLSKLTLTITKISDSRLDIITDGFLHCIKCQKKYPIVRGIPRFVCLRNYASSFGFQWTIHNKTQYDSYSGMEISKNRFFNETHWSKNLVDQKILEVGCGSGRFTEQVTSTGAFVVSMDYSYAVEANYQSNGSKENLLIVQADLYHMPFPRKFFDKLFCFGVLQHTPDVKRAFMSLPIMVREGGELVIDVYCRTFRHFLRLRYLLRPFTKQIEPQKLYTFIKNWIDFTYPIWRYISKIPIMGPSINDRLFLIADHSRYGLKGDLLKSWAYLDAFDQLSPRYDDPQSIWVVQQWFSEAGLVEVEVNYGFNGIEGRGKIPILRGKTKTDSLTV